jgi:hypothetical protein
MWLEMITPGGMWHERFNVMKNTKPLYKNKKHYVVLFGMAIAFELLLQYWYHYPPKNAWAIAMTFAKYLPQIGGISELHRLPRFGERIAFVLAVGHVPMFCLGAWGLLREKQMGNTNIASGGLRLLIGLPLCVFAILVATYGIYWSNLYPDRYQLMPAFLAVGTPFVIGICTYGLFLMLHAAWNKYFKE